jgi:tetratricopeptide (TPR) repeat protein
MRTRLWRLLFPICLFACFVYGQDKDKKENKHTPSTPEERANVVKLAKRLESDPFDKDAKKIRSAIINWIAEVPDLKVTVCSLIPELVTSKKNYHLELFGQSMISSAAFVSAHPELSEDYMLVNTASIEGTLHVYQIILKVHPEARWMVLDDLLQKSLTEEFYDFTEDATKKCNLPTMPDEKDEKKKQTLAQGYLDLGNKFYDDGEYQLAMVEYRRLLKLEPESYSPYHELSQTFYSLKNFGKAMEYANRAIAINPKCWLCYQALGNIYDDSGKPEEAIAQYKKAMEIVPNSGRPAYNYAVTLSHLKRDQEAIGALQDAVKLDPGYASAHYLLGRLLAKNGELYAAQDHLNKFIQLEPRGERFDKATKLLNPSVHLEPDKVEKNTPQFDAYAAYGITRLKWVMTEYHKKYPSISVYKTTPEEEIDALQREAVKWQELKKSSNKVIDNNLDRLLRIHESGLIVPFVYANSETHFPQEYANWTKDNSAAVENLQHWATENSVSLSPIQQPLQIEWLGENP